jgi:hypothetical protein
LFKKAVVDLRCSKWVLLLNTGLIQWSTIECAEKNITGGYNNGLFRKEAGFSVKYREKNVSKFETGKTLLKVANRLFHYVR